MAYQLTYPEITLYLRELAPACVDDMLSFKGSTVFVEAVGEEYRDVIKPRVARCSTEKNPPIVSGDLYKGLGPSTCSHNSLFVEYEEGVFDILVPSDVVPGIYG